jgi:hypothetical protein
MRVKVDVKATATVMVMAKSRFEYESERLLIGLYWHKPKEQRLLQRREVGFHPKHIYNFRLFRAAVSSKSCSPPPLSEVS